jgi:hypothetical protein
MNKDIKAYISRFIVATTLSISSISASDELSLALSLKVSGCVFTLDQFVNNAGSDGTPVSEAYRIYSISGFSFEDVIFLKKGDQWNIYWRNGIRDNVYTDFSTLPIFKSRFDSDIATRLLDTIATPELWKEKNHDSGDAGDDGSKIVIARWSNGGTVFKHFRSKTNTKELTSAAELAGEFWKLFEAKRAPKNKK